MINSDTRLCISLAARPGRFGNRFHNYLYGELRLNYVYRSGTTSDLPAAIAGLKALRIRGCGLSMPYKEQVGALLSGPGDSIDPVARKIGAINTIVNHDLDGDLDGPGRLTGYNTDAVAIWELAHSRAVGPSSRVAVAGSGGMARACVYALSLLGCKDVTVLSRNAETGQALAQAYGYEWAEPASAQPGRYDVLINATPVGMTPDPPDRLSFPEAVVRAARVVIESVAYPERTALVGVARDAGLSVVTGFDVTLTQAVEQFRLYTGVTLRVDQVGRAAVYARAT